MDSVTELLIKTTLTFLLAEIFSPSSLVSLRLRTLTASDGLVHQKPPLTTSDLRDARLLSPRWKDGLLVTGSPSIRLMPMARSASTPSRSSSETKNTLSSTEIKG